MRKSQKSNYLYPHTNCVFSLCYIAIGVGVYLTLFSFSFLLLPLQLNNTAYAKENTLTILYTGQTHAMLYHCNCPLEPDGGISRRATLIKQLKSQHPNNLLLDSGNFFAAGILDEYSQNAELDKERTLINLKAMELMKYDAVALGDDEFNFGVDFLQQTIRKTNLKFLSSNLGASNLAGQFKEVLPYIIKEVAGVKVGIVGLTNLYAKQKAASLNFLEPKPVVKKTVKALKESGADLIILLSNLTEQENLNLINEVSGIDILIAGRTEKNEPFSKVGSSLILYPSWQGRKLGSLSLALEDNRIKAHKVERIRLSDQTSDAQEILAILPRCFSDANCKHKTLIGVCQDVGSIHSRCIFSEAKKVKLLVIKPKACRVCNTESVVRSLKEMMPGLSVLTLDYPGAEANKLVKDFAITGLPAYLLGKELETEKAFDRLKVHLKAGGNYYFLKPEFIGISYFLGRKNLKPRLDLFISLYDKYTPEILQETKEFNPLIHFLAVEQEGKLSAAKGILELEEDLRSVCVQKYYPEYFWDYINCRAKNINSSWWQNCLGKFNAETIKACAQDKEGELLLKENIILNKELGIMFGPTYLLDNQQIFSSQGVPNKEELRKIIKK